MAKSPYIKTEWKDRVGVTPGTALNAVNFNKLEEGLVATDTLAIDLESRVAVIESSESESSISEMQSTIQKLTTDLKALTEAFNTHIHKIDAGENTSVPTSIVE